MTEASLKNLISAETMSKLSNFRGYKKSDLADFGFDESHWFNGNWIR